MNNCTCCGCEVHNDDICDECRDIGRKGTVVICASCNKIALTLLLKETEDISYVENGGDFRRMYWIPVCRNCSLDFKPSDFLLFNDKEEAIKSINQ